MEDGLLYERSRSRSSTNQGSKGSIVGARAVGRGGARKIRGIFTTRPLRLPCWPAPDSWWNPTDLYLFTSSTTYVIISVTNTNGTRETMSFPKRFPERKRQRLQALHPPRSGYPSPACTQTARYTSRPRYRSLERVFPVPDN